jgi:AcrR family transcriptional regulator
MPMPRARTEIPRDSQAKLQHILQHAARVFSEKGYEGASIRDISRATDVSLAGLYYYFESKQKLLYLIQIHAFKSILEQLEELLEGVQEPEERLRLFVRNHIAYFLSHPHEMKVLAHEDTMLEEPYRKEVAEIKRRYYELARGIFEDLRRQGRATAVNPRVAVLSLYGMMNWIYKWYNIKVDPRAEALADAMASIFLNGVLDDGRTRKVARPVIMRQRPASPGVRAAG